MGKAYTEEEKEQIRVRIMEEGLNLFHENGSKSLSIRELAKRVGISQGGFYNFYADKQALVLDIAKYRSRQKTELAMEGLRQHSEDPVSFLAEVFYTFVMDISDKAVRKQMYRDMLQMLSEASYKGQTDGMMDEVILRIRSVLKESGVKVQIDAMGIKTVMSSVCILAENHALLSEEYLGEMIRILIEEGMRRYMKVEEEERSQED